MPWPEWRDSDLNNERWQIPKGELFRDAEPVAMPRSLEPDRWIRAKDLKHSTVLSLLSRCFIYDKHIRLDNGNIPGASDGVHDDRGISGSSYEQ